MKKWNVCCSSSLLQKICTSKLRHPMPCCGSLLLLLFAALEALQSKFLSRRIICGYSFLLLCCLSRICTRNPSKEMTCLLLLLLASALGDLGSEYVGQHQDGCLLHCSSCLKEFETRLTRPHSMCGCSLPFSTSQDLHIRISVPPPNVRLLFSSSVSLLPL